MVGGREGEAERGQESSRHGRGPQPDPVRQDPGQEGEEEGGPDGQRPDQGTLEGSLLIPSGLQVGLQFDEEDPEGVDDTEDHAIDNEGADHDKPGL